MNKLDKLEKQYKKLGEEIEKLKKEQSEIKLYDIIKFSGFDWYVIDKDGDGNLVLLMKDRFTSSQMQQCFDNRLLDSDRDIQFSKTSNNIWCDSQIRMTLNSNFLRELDMTKLNLITTKLTSVNKEYITRDYVRLLTKEEADKLPSDILRCSGNYGYWTMSPYSNSYSYHVWYVFSTGNLHHSYAGTSYGVRPVIYLKSDINDACEIVEFNETNGLVGKRVWRVKDE